MNGFITPGDIAGLITLRDGMVVADLGTGSGHYALALASRMQQEGVKDCTVYAVDVQKALLERLKQEADRRDLPQVQVIWGDLDTLGGTKLADKIADVTILSNVLLQSEDKTKLMHELVRITKQGGQVYIIDWTDKSVSREMGKELALAAGLSLIKEFDAGSHHWGLLMQKAQVTMPKAQ